MNTLKVILLAAVIAIVSAKKEQCMLPGVLCVNDCQGVVNGNYPSCSGCEFFVTCVGGTIFKDRPCPGNEFWDNELGRCAFDSETCTDCESMKNRDCKILGGTCVETCSKGKTCENGVLYDQTSCGPNKRCCIETVVLTTTTATTPAMNATAPGFTKGCMDCMCEASGCEARIGKCDTTCGPFGLTWGYWSDCGKPEKYFNCVTQMDCSRQCVNAYMIKYSDDAHNTCEYYARVHYGGKYGWNSHTTDNYWSKVNKCCQGKDADC